MSLLDWRRRGRPTGSLGALPFLAGAVAALMVLTVLAVLGLVLMALVAVLMGAERLLALLVPAYRRRRRERYLTMPAGLVRVVHFGSRPSQVIDARSYELPDDASRH